jgi:RNA methyltransferase, TrmH family
VIEEPITSSRNPRVAAARALRDRRRRDETGLTLVDGAREVWRAMQAGVELETVFVCPPLIHGPDGAAVLDALAARARTSRDVRLEVGPQAHERLAYGDRSDGIVAVVRPARHALADLSLSATPLVAVLEGVQKPGNVGAILRSADAAGLDAVVVADPATDLYNPNTIRASLGCIFSVPVAAATTDEVLGWLRQRDLTAVVARVDATCAYTEVDYRTATAIVLGSEAAGLTDRWSGPSMVAVHLPMAGAADSLSVSAAAAVLFYEARRQRDAS